LSHLGSLLLFVSRVGVVSVRLKDNSVPCAL
jgi:hypothetical protein